MIERVLPSCSRLLFAFLAMACVYLFFLDPWGHDTWFHLQRLQDIERQLEWGHWRAYFAENAAQDKGLPVWIYYSQWIYWPAILLTSIGISPLIALKILYCVLLVVCSLGFYQLLRLHVDQDRATFGALLFTTSNFVVGEVFQRSAYSEFMSVALLPLLLVAMHRVLGTDDRRAGSLVVLLSALMILSHPLSFMNSGLAIVAYAVYLGIKEKLPLSRFMALVPPLALGLALTAFYWLPAVLETRYVRGAEGVPTPLDQTFLSIARYLNFSGITSLGLGLTLLAPVVIAFALLRRTDKGWLTGRPWWPLLFAVGLYIFLTFRVSGPLYEAIPLLASNLWVWRVLFQITLLTVLLTVICLPALPPRMRSATVLRGLAVLGVLQAAALVGWNTREEFTLRPMPVPAIEARIEVESQFKDGFGIDEYLPQTRLLPRPPKDCAHVRTMEATGRYEMSFVIDPDDVTACIHVQRYWNTRYAASIDGVPTPVYADGSGELLLGPAGRVGLLSLRFTVPPYVTFANLLSAVAALLLLARIARQRR